MSGAARDGELNGSARPTPNRRVMWLLVVGLGAAAVALFWQQRIEAPVRVHAVTAENLDDYYYYYPTFTYAFRELRHGHLPFWNPHQHCGTPFFATAQHLLLYPLNLPYLVLPTADAMRVANAAHLVLALIFMAVLCRVIGLSWIAAFSAGVTFALSPGVAVLIYVPHHLYGAVWMPLHLALVHLAVTRSRQPLWSVLLGVTLAAQYLGGYPMFSLFSAYAVAGYAAWLLIGGWRAGVPGGQLWRGALAVACGAALAVALSAPQLLPAIELSSASPRTLGGLSIDQADPRSGRVPLLRILFDALLPAHGRRFVDPVPDVGFVALVLACLAPLHRRQRSTVGFFLCCTLLSAAIALGQMTPLYRLYFALPTSGLFRLPVRFFTVTVLGLSVLAGVGVDWLWRRDAARRSLAAAGAIALVLAALLTASLYLAPEQWGAAQRAYWPASAYDAGLLARTHLAAAYLWITAAWIAAYWFAGASARRGLTVLLPVGIYVSLFLTFINRSAIPDLEPDVHSMPASAVAFLRSRTDHGRAYIPPPAGPFAKRATEIPTKAGMLYGFDSIGDRENVYAARFARFIEPLAAPQNPLARALLRNLPPERAPIPQGEFWVGADSPAMRLFDLLGATYIVLGRDDTFHAERDPQRFALEWEQDGVRIYRNRQAMPRAYLVHRAEVIPQPERALARLSDDDFDARAAAVVEEPLAAALPSAAAPPGSAAITQYDAREVVVDVDSPAPGLLVLSDQFYPGWEVEVDGKPARLHRANYLFRAVEVDAGRHQVRFRFVPHSFYRGVAVAGGALLVTAVALVLWWLWSAGAQLPLWGGRGRGV